jgi:uncharacterized membrane protein YgdD (TMEM256/DUF423 family)
MNPWLAVAALNGFLAVAMGAFAAHGLSGRLDPHALQIFDTAARYHMYHALALGLAAQGKTGASRIAAAFFLAGIVLFSGSLYLLALCAWRPLGFITPFGGIAFLVGWAALLVGAMKTPRHSGP